MNLAQALTDNQKMQCPHQQKMTDHIIFTNVNT